MSRRARAFHRLHAGQPGPLTGLLVVAALASSGALGADLVVSITKFIGI